MDPFEKPKKSNFSFPNMDQHIPGVFDPNRPADQSVPEQIKPKRVVNIMEALSGETKNGEDAQTIRTYQGDIAGAIKNDNVSMIKIALAEKKRQDDRRGMANFDGGAQPISNTKYIAIAGIFTVIVLVGLAGGYIYLQAQTAKQAAVQEAMVTVPQIIYTETASDFGIDDKDPNEILRSVQQEKDGIMDLGTMKSIFMTTGEGTSTRDITSSEFFQALGTRAPEGLTRSLESNFLFGVYAYTPREMFAIFKVKSYDSAFASMLEWEPNIETDIGNIFINKDVQADTTQASAISASGTGTPDSTPGLSSMTAGTTSSLQIFTKKSFVDKVISNKDTRVLQDPQGKSFMLYTFLDKDTLVFATSEKALKEILFRLTTGRIVR